MTMLQCPKCLHYGTMCSCLDELRYIPSVHISMKLIDEVEEQIHKTNLMMKANIVDTPSPCEKIAMLFLYDQHGRPRY